MSRSLARRTLLELLVGPELAKVSEERFHLQVPPWPAYAQAVCRLQEWQLLHQTTCHAWLGPASEGHSAR